MALKKYTLIDYKTASLNGVSHSYYVGDTFAELPTTGMAQGDLAFDKSTNQLYVATSATTLALVSGIVSGGSALTLTPSSAIDRFVLSGRTTPGFAVPYLQPTTTNQYVAFDIVPKGTPPANLDSSTGVAWIDIVDRDVIAAPGNWEGLRLGKLKNGAVHVGQATAGTGVVRQLILQMNSGTVGINNADTTLYRSAAAALKTDGTFEAVGGIVGTGSPITKNAAWLDATAVTPSTIAAWTAPFACTVTTIKGYRTGGSGATVQAYRGTTATTLRSSALSLTSADTWMDGITGIQNTAFTSGQSLLMGVVSVSGAVTQVSIQVNFVRP